MHDHDPRQIQIYGSAQERRGNSERNKVYKEVVLGERTIVHHYSSDVADDFRHHPNSCCGHEAPGAVFDTQNELNKETSSKYDREEGVAC